MEQQKLKSHIRKILPNKHTPALHTQASTTTKKKYILRKYHEKYTEINTNTRKHQRHTKTPKMCKINKAIKNKRQCGSLKNRENKKKNLQKTTRGGCTLKPKQRAPFQPASMWLKWSRAFFLTTTCFVCVFVIRIKIVF